MFASFRGVFASIEPRRAPVRRTSAPIIHRLKTTSLTTNFPITQVAFGAPSKAMKASFVRPKAVRKGVVAMSASTDDIIEKMKTLTVSPRTRHRPKRAEFHRIKRMRSGF
jgi:hypothetical protein